MSDSKVFSLLEKAWSEMPTDQEKILYTGPLCKELKASLRPYVLTAQPLDEKIYLSIPTSESYFVGYATALFEVFKSDLQTTPERLSTNSSILEKCQQLLCLADIYLRQKFWTSVYGEKYREISKLLTATQQAWLAEAWQGEQRFLRREADRIQVQLTAEDTKITTLIESITQARTVAAGTEDPVVALAQWEKIKEQSLTAALSPGHERHETLPTLFNEVNTALENTKIQVGQEKLARQRAEEVSKINEYKQTAEKSLVNLIHTSSEINQIRHLNTAMTWLEKACAIDTQGLFITDFTQQIQAIEQLLKAQYMRVDTLIAEGSLPLVTEQGHTVKLKNQKGEGGFGEVYEADYITTDGNPTQVAVKLFKFERLDEAALTQFQREATLIASITHDNIVKYYDRINAAPRFGLVMEFMPMGSLFDAYSSGVPFTMSERWEIAKDAIAGLEALHAHDIIHRDLKGANLLLKKTGSRYTAKWGDFGLAQVQETVVENVVKTQQSTLGNHQVEHIAGTARWIAPEVFQSINREHTKKSDMWGAGMTLWELYAGKPPFSKCDDLSLVRDEIKTHGARNMLKNPAMESEPKIASLVRWCWKMDPTERPNANDALKALPGDSEAPRPPPSRGPRMPGLFS